WGSAQVGALWCGANRACRQAFRDAQVCRWWAGGPRRLSHACHKWRETWWDAGRYVETIAAGRREGRDDLGRGNMASRWGPSGRRFKSCRSDAVMSRDIVGRCPETSLAFRAGFGAVSAFDAAGLVVAGGVEDEFADELSGVALQDADVEVVDEHRDGG